jgi:hypothetical protein
VFSIPQEIKKINGVNLSIDRPPFTQKSQGQMLNLTMQAFVAYLMMVMLKINSRRRGTQLM